MRIVVTTPTGNIGSRVVQVLLQAGARPTLLARYPARLDPRVLERADVVRTDLADSDAVVRATRGADALFWLAPFNADPDADPVAWYAQLGATAARAVTENGIARTVFISSVGAEKRTGIGEIAGLASTEEVLDATGSSVLHLRCGYFYTNLDLDSRAETISEDALRASLRAGGFGDKQIEGMVGMSAVMRPDFVPEDKRSIVTTTPTTLAAWAHARLRPLFQAESAA
jgi:uncharacterized protein YbjT (DUF2867 family)